MYVAVAVAAVLIALIAVGVAVWALRRRGVNVGPESAPVDIVLDSAPDEGTPMDDSPSDTQAEVFPVRPPTDFGEEEWGAADDEGGDAAGVADDSVTVIPEEDVIVEPAPTRDDKEDDVQVVDIPDDDIVVEEPPAQDRPETVIDVPVEEAEPEGRKMTAKESRRTKPAVNTAKHASQHFAATLSPSAFYGDIAVEELLNKVAQAAPFLTEATKLGDGEFLGWEDQNKFWWAVDAPDGAAAFVVSDDPQWMDNHFQELRATPPIPLKHHQISAERPPEELLEILTEGQVVPAWESPDFAHLDDGRGFPVLPAKVREAARGWIDTPYGELAREYTLNGLETTAFVALDRLVGLGDEGMPTLFVGVGPVGEDQHVDFLEYAKSLGFEPRVVEGQGFLIEPVSPTVTQAELEAQALALAKAVTS